MTGILLLTTIALAEPLIFDDGEVRCVLFESDPVGVHEEALAAWAPRGEPGEDVLEPCEPVEPKVAEIRKELGAPLAFAQPVDKYAAADGVKVARMATGWLHVRGEGDLAVTLEDGSPVLIRLEEVAGERPKLRAGSVFDLGFEAAYVGGTGELLRIGNSVMVLSAGEVLIQEEGQPPEAFTVAPDNKDSQVALRPGQSRTMAMDEEVLEVVVGNPLVATAIVKGRKVKIMADGAGETRVGLVLSGGRVLPLRVLVR